MHIFYLHRVKGYSFHSQLKDPFIRRIIRYELHTHSNSVFIILHQPFIYTQLPVSGQPDALIKPAMMFELKWATVEGFPRKKEGELIPEDGQVILEEDDFESILDALRNANTQHSELRSVHQFIYFLHLYHVLLSDIFQSVQLTTE